MSEVVSRWSPGSNLDFAALLNNIQWRHTSVTALSSISHDQYTTDNPIHPHPYLFVSFMISQTRVFDANIVIYATGVTLIEKRDWGSWLLIESWKSVYSEYPCLPVLIRYRRLCLFIIWACWQANYVWLFFLNNFMVCSLHSLRRCSCSCNL